MIEKRGLTGLKGPILFFYMLINPNSTLFIRILSRPAFQDRDLFSASTTHS